jgi:virulence factor Mce-like protein
VRRIVALLIVFTFVFAAMAAVLLLPGRSGYHVDAIFNDVDFLIPGQQVRIAGTTVGQVEAIKLTNDRKARVEMVLGSQYAPFHSNANCEVEPQSLIGDRYVNCMPGTPQYPALDATAGQPPTLPVSNTNSPVDLDLVLQTLNQPVRERVALLLDSLGVGLTAQGGDLNQAILNANPALQETRSVLSILNQNRAQLQSLISASDTVLGRLATSRSRVQAFVRNSATILNTTAANRGTLGQAATLQHALPSITPQIDRLKAFAAQAPAAGKLVSTLFTSLRGSGAADGLLEFAYYAAAAFARYDNIPHILPAYALATVCEVYATTPTSGCNAHFASYNAASDKASGAHARRTRATHARPGGSVHAPTQTTGTNAPGKHSGPSTAPPSATTTTTPTTPAPPAQQQNPVSSLLQFLLGK